MQEQQGSHAAETVRVKICGLRSVEAALAAARAGADLLGFNFAPVSRRRVDPAIAREAAEALADKAPAGEAAPGAQPRGPRPALVGIFVNQPLEQVAGLVERCALDYVQLSGDEDAAYCRAVSAVAGARVIKAVRLASQSEEQVARLVEESGVALVLADAAVAGLWGGSGQAWDWRAAAGLAARYPLLLAGGLHAGNVGAAIAAVRPFGVDVASGVETGGVTDPQKVRDFIQSAKGAI